MTGIAGAEADESEASTFSSTFSVIVALVSVLEEDQGASLENPTFSKERGEETSQKPLVPEADADADADADVVLGGGGELGRESRGSAICA